MSTTNATILQSVGESIRDLIVAFQSTPYTFLFESDLQATLFAKLRTSIRKQLAVPGSGRPQNLYKLSIVHTEYLKRIDIACIDIEAAAHVKPRVRAGSDIHIYQLPVLVGIELKYRKMGDGFGLMACLADLEKLTRLNIARPIVLGFVQNHAEISAFLSDRPGGCRCVEASRMDPLARVNVISPESCWRVEIPSGVELG